MNKTLLIHANDDVEVALQALQPGDRLSSNGAQVTVAIENGHKVARHPIATGQAVHKFGQVIGYASEDIAPGTHVHVHNLRADTASLNSEPTALQPQAVVSAGAKAATFQGYLRANGKVGTRNYIGIVTSVNCSATVAQQIAAYFDHQRLAEYPNVDGVICFTHQGGCGMSASNNQGLENLQRTLAGYLQHPNFAKMLLIGLGCEVNQPQALLQKYQLEESDDLAVIGIQEQGGTRASISKGIAIIQAWLPQANRCQRQTLSAEHLILGLQCGGSDSYSGLTANPALGVAADLLVAQGGKAILSETPEIVGAEQLLLSRASNAQVQQQLLEKLRWWQNYAELHGISLNNNPSPGNLKGGITTILEKSLGAVAKGGNSPLTGVYDYAAPITLPGLAFMDAPGYDPCSVTGEIASGANLIAFTTGRGSVFGAKPAPSIKLASTSQLFAHMQEDMDLNCGAIIDREVDIEGMGKRIFDYLLAVASGQQSASEKLGFGQHEFVPWQLGAWL